MSEELEHIDEADVDSHVHRHAANDEPSNDDDDSDFDAHIMKMPNVRMDSPSNT